MRTGTPAGSFVTAAAVILALCGCNGTASPAHWEQVKPTGTSRAGAGIAVLQSGHVLVAGGRAFPYDEHGTRLPMVIHASAEIYDPSSGSWTPTGSMTVARDLQQLMSSLVTLPSGKVLAAGGTSMDYGVIETAEIFDPTSGLWTPTGSMRTQRVSSLMLLRTGKVLAAGGVRVATTDVPYDRPSAEAELYDPETGEWAPTGSMQQARDTPTLVMLDSGKVLAVGGRIQPDFPGGSTNSAELYDPETGAWEPAGYVDAPITSGSAVRLATGEVLVIGGGDRSFSYVTDDNTRCSLYDPSTGKWRPTAPVSWGRIVAAAFLLHGGKVLVAGGTLDSLGGTHTEIYDRTTETWTEGLSLRHDHGDGAASVMLPGGEVLIAGGVTALKPTLGDYSLDTLPLYSITAVEIYREP
jgi:hypothetical protein